MSTTTLAAALGTTGLVDVGYRFIDADGVFTGGRQTAAVYELAGARGWYGIKNPSIPADATKVYWDSTGTAAVYAYEQLDYCMTRLLVDRTSVYTGAVTQGATTYATLTSTGLFTTGGFTSGAITASGITAGAFSATTFSTSGTMTLNALTVANNTNFSGTLTVAGTTLLAGAVTLGNTLTLTGNFQLNDGMTIVAPSTVDRPGISITGNGNGEAITAIGGITAPGVTISGLSNSALHLVGAGSSAALAMTSDSGIALYAQSGGNAPAVYLLGSGTEAGLSINGGSSDGDGVTITAGGSGGGISINAPTNDAINLNGNLTVGGTTTLVGAASLVSNLTIGGNAAVTGSTTLNSLIVSTTTTLTGAVSLGSTLGITGAFTATNASNNIKGVDVTRWLGTTVSTPTVAGVPNVNAKTWNDLATVALPLTSTTAGRTLDVSATGEAGVDWNNVGTPSSTVNLSNTRIALVDLVTTVTNNPNAGNGAYTVTGTVTDGVTPLPLATVRITAGINTYSTVTNGSGQFTFAADAGTYTVTATLNGYQSLNTTRTVTGNNAGTLASSPLVLVVNVIPATPTDPSLCRIYGYIRNTRTNAVMPNVEVIATLEPGKVAYAGGFLVGRECRARTNSVGLFQLDVTKNNEITPTGSKWLVKCDQAGIHYKASFTTSTFDLSTVLP